MKLSAKFTHPTAGYACDIADGKQFLTLNKTYEVERVVMGQSYTNIHLEDFPGRSFNSVLFDFYHGDTEIDLSDFPEYNPYL